MLLIVLSLFACACVAAPLVRRWGARAGLLLAAVPLLALVALVWAAPTGGEWVQAHRWWPSLDIGMALRLDGLSLLMSGLILGIGTLVFAYASRYLDGDPAQPRFYGIVFAFAGAMLGVVLADDLLALFVFWELTSVTSFLLIGYQHERAEARASALQGLVVTAGGGLVMLAGFIVLGDIAGTLRIGELAALRDTIVTHPRYPLALLLIAVGCFTKSAQFPFHFWLPNAMAAPTPVSAYLHSATMVKAGVYLLARLHPSMGGSELWFWLLGASGATTMVLGALLAYRNSGFKAVLAATTLMALGTLVMTLGLGAPAAAVTFLLAHALYKGPLFLIAGIIDHETGARDLHDVAGQRRALPVTFAAAVTAALSLAALPPVFGFIAKELVLEEALHVPHGALFAAAVVVAALLVTAMALQLALRPFLGAPRAPSAHVHEAPWPMLAGPVTLAGLGLLFGLLPALPESLVLNAAARSAGADGEPLHLALWHGVNLPLMLSLLSLLLGLAAAALWPRLQPRLMAMRWPEIIGPEAIYGVLMAALDRAAAGVTRRLQSGRLRSYVTLIMLVVIGITGSTLITAALELIHPPARWPDEWLPALIGALILGVTLMATRMRGALAVIVTLSAAGFSVALVFLWYSALDVAITQILIETLTAIFLVLVLFRLPALRQLTTRWERGRDAAIAGVLGLLVTALIWMVRTGREHPSISSWFIENSVTLGHGRNIVNVILVDFRAFDTLGEIFVLALAAFGVSAMLHRGGRDGGRR